MRYNMIKKLLFMQIIFIIVNICNFLIIIFITKNILGSRMSTI